MRKTQIAFFVYDVTRASTLDRLRMWADNLKSSEDISQIVIRVLCNKIDLLSERERLEIVRQGHEIARDLGSSCHEVSAKDGTGVCDIFDEALFEAHLRSAKSLDDLRKEREARVDVNSPGPKQANGCC